MRRSIPLLLLALLLPACDRGEPATAQPAAPPPGVPARVAVLDVQGIVGLQIDARLLGAAYDRLEREAGREPDILVLAFDSPGGQLAAVPRLSDLIHDELRRRTRVVAWVDRAESAAALVALTAPELAMRPRGVIGGALAYDASSGAARPLEGEDQQTALEAGAIVAERGGHHPAILRAMQSDEGLTLEGHTYAAPGEILTLNALDAERLGISLGTPDTLDQLADLLGVPEHEVVGADARDWLAEQSKDILAASAEAQQLRSRIRNAIAEAEAAIDAQHREEVVQQGLALIDDLRRLTARHPSVGVYHALDERTLTGWEVDLELGIVPEPTPTDG